MFLQISVELQGYGICLIRQLKIEKKNHNIQNIHSKGMNNSIKITNKIIYLTVKLIQSEHIWDHLAYYISFLLKC